MLLLIFLIACYKNGKILRCKISFFKNPDDDASVHMPNSGLDHVQNTLLNWGTKSALEKFSTEI